MGVGFAGSLEVAVNSGVCEEFPGADFGGILYVECFDAGGTAGLVGLVAVEGGFGIGVCCAGVEAVFGKTFSVTGITGAAFGGIADFGDILTVF